MRRTLSLVAALCVALIVASCRDSATGSTSPIGKLAPGALRRAMDPGTCISLANLKRGAGLVFSPNTANVNAAIAYLNSIDGKIHQGDIPGAEREARNLLTFIGQKADQITAPHSQVQEFINAILCYAGVVPDTHIVFPDDQPSVITEPTGTAGISLPANTVDVPTLVTLQVADPGDPTPLITKLDQYPGYVTISSSTPLTKPVIVAVCPAGTIPPEILARLRLGHQASSGFEVTPQADASFLNCPTALGASKSPGWLRKLANLVLPKTAYAASMFGGGVGGVATEFSPFGPVDPELSFSGGVGGTSTEFSIGRTVPGVSRSVGAPMGLAAATSCSPLQATVGTPVAQGCRPVVTIKTHNGTVFQNVPVSWSVTQGGGAIAPNDINTSNCGAFGATAGMTTDANGVASICWTLGIFAGTNTVNATPGVGGDAPAGVTFTPSTGTFTATGNKIVPTATASGVTTTYNGGGHAGSGTCSDGLTPALSYSPVGTPLNVGTSTLTVTCGGGPTYDVATASAPIVITPLGATATAASKSIVFGSPVPSLGCVVAGLLPFESTAVTCSSSLPAQIVPGSNAVTPVISPSVPENYSVTPVNGTLLVQYIQDGCLGTPLTSGLPSAANYQTKGAKLTLRCALKDVSRNPVTNATGDLLVQDRGTNGTASAVNVLTLQNVFTFSGIGHSYVLNTSASRFLIGHYYQVIAVWNDGSTSSGYFFLKP